MKKFLALFLALVLFPATSVSAEIAGWTGTPSPVAWWSTTGAGTELKGDISVEKDNTNGYYYYSIYSNFESGTGFYGGLQINGYNGYGSVIPRMAIFSIWDATSGTAANGGWGTTFGNEGVGYSVRIAYPWVAGRTYTLSFSLQSDNGTTKTWKAEIFDNSSGATTLIGSINTPSSNGQIKSNIATFHERFYGSTESCDILEPSRVKFNNIILNGNRGAVYTTIKGTAGLCSNSGTLSESGEFLSWFNAARDAPSTPKAETSAVKPAVPVPAKTEEQPKAPDLKNNEASKTGDKNATSLALDTGAPNGGNRAGLILSITALAVIGAVAVSIFLYQKKRPRVHRELKGVPMDGIMPVHVVSHKSDDRD